MKRDVTLYLKDILECISLLEKYISGKTERDIEYDNQLRDAVIRRIEIIGEAAYQLPSAFKEKYSSIPWKDIVNMRNVLIHEYFGVYPDRVFKVIKEDLPILRKQISDLLAES